MGAGVVEARLSYGFAIFDSKSEVSFLVRNAISARNPRTKQTIPNRQIEHLLTFVLAEALSAR